MLGLLQIFYDPAKVFARVREKGIWLIPFLAVSLTIMTTVAITVNLIGMENMTRKQLESNPKLAEQIGPEKLDKIIRDSDTPARKALACVAGGAGGAFYLLLIAGIFTGLLSLMSGTAKFKQVLGASSYALFPFSVLTCLMSTLIILLSNDRSELNLRNLIALNPGAFLDKETTGKSLYSVASSLDLLSFGQIAMLAYGLSKVSGVPLTKCLMMILALWAIYVLGKAGVAAIF